MPQLDFFTIQSQLFCLVLSIFLIYSLLLKYAMPAYDVYLRLKIKKLTYYRTQNAILTALVLSFKERAVLFASVMVNLVSEFSKIYFNFIITMTPLLYYIYVSRKKSEIANLKPLEIAISNSVKVVEKESYFLRRKPLKQAEIISLIKGF